MKNFIPQSPDPFITRESDMALARMGHLNAIVEVVNNFYSVRTRTLTPSETLDVSTSDRSTIIRFDSSLSSDITFTATDKSGIQVGDSLTIMTLVNVLSESVKLIFDTSDFFLTTCGEVEDNIDITGIERNICKFIFDGDKYVSTYDNC